MIHFPLLSPSLDDCEIRFPDLETCGAPHLGLHSHTKAAAQDAMDSESCTTKQAWTGHLADLCSKGNKKMTRGKDVSLPPTFWRRGYSRGPNEQPQCFEEGETPNFCARDAHKTCITYTATVKEHRLGLHYLRTRLRRLLSLCHLASPSISNGYTRKIRFHMALRPALSETVLSGAGGGSRWLPTVLLRSQFAPIQRTAAISWCNRICSLRTVWSQPF